MVLTPVRLPKIDEKWDIANGHSTCFGIKLLSRYFFWPASISSRTFSICFVGVNSFLNTRVLVCPSPFSRVTNSNPIFSAPSMNDRLSSRFDRIRTVHDTGSNGAKVSNDAISIRRCLHSRGARGDESCAVARRSWRCCEGEDRIANADRSLTCLHPNHSMLKGGLAIMKHQARNSYP